MTFIGILLLVVIGLLWLFLFGLSIAFSFGFLNNMYEAAWLDPRRIAGVIGLVLTITFLLYVVAIADGVSDPHRNQLCLRGNQVWKSQDGVQKQKVWVCEEWER